MLKIILFYLAIKITFRDINLTLYIKFISLLDVISIAKN